MLFVVARTAAVIWFGTILSIVIIVFATAAFPKRIPVTFIMLKIEFVSVCNCYCCTKGFPFFFLFVVKTFLLSGELRL